MTDTDDHREAVLERIGTDPTVVDAIERLDAVMLNWRRKMTKRELGRRAIETLGLAIDQPQLNVLFAIAMSSDEDGSENETMVATVAERLAIDPSRASRLVADTVTSGYARRAVSQADARRTIVELTEKGRAITDAVQAYKWLMMADYFKGWSTEDIAIFVPLLERYTQWFRDVAESEARLASEIAAISRSVTKADDLPEPESA